MEAFQQIPMRWSGTDEAGHRLSFIGTLADVRGGIIATAWCDRCGAHVTADWRLSLWETPVSGKVRTGWISMDVGSEPSFSMRTERRRHVDGTWRVDAEQSNG